MESEIWNSEEGEGESGRFSEKGTSNIERPTSNVEWEKMKKQK